MSTATLERAKVTTWLQNYGVYLAVVVLLLFNVGFTENFLSAANFRTQLVQAAPVCIVALGLALVIGTEGIDLSVGSVMSIAAALIPLYLGAGPLTAIVVAVIAGIVSGLFSGYLVAYLGIQPIIATLALLVGGRGLALVIAHGQLVQLHNRDFLELGTGAVLGVPITVIVAGVLAVLAGLLVQRTTFGRHLVAVGGNRAASTLAG
ncbi:ABC transporter permease, partial [Amycolatopsis kentuckyensis]|uniref:ABC transporter permease n=1 Tax=Amycolatopsis kentuckyensis TaxID=218823 RepID=UPI001177DECF